MPHRIIRSRYTDLDGWTVTFGTARRVLDGAVEFYLYPTVGTVLIHSVKPELTE